MVNRNNIFVIIKNRDNKITYEVYLLKLIKLMKCFNEVVIHSQIGCQELTNSLIDDIIGVGGWIKEYERKRKIMCQNKSDKKKRYQLEIFEYCIRRDVHNQLKNGI